MASLLDEISPRYYGEDRLTLTLADPDQALRAFVPIVVSVDVSRALPEGLVLPLEFTVTGPDNVRIARTLYRRFVPIELAFVPIGGGSHLVRLVELYHNLYWGKLVLDIAGDRLRAE
jgi:hypothetical protein